MIKLELKAVAGALNTKDKVSVHRKSGARTDSS